MSGRRLLIPAAVLLLLSAARGAPGERLPSIGYLYAAGGQQGTTVKVTVGGQNLQGTREVLFTGRGLRAKVVGYRRTQRIKNEQLQELRRTLARLARQKTAALTGASRGRPERRRRGGGARKPAAGAKKPAAGAKKPDGKGGGAKKEPEPVELPDHPLLEGLERMSLRELRKVSEFFFDPARRLQESPQIASQVDLEVTIDAGAEPGDHELRLVTRFGLSNPLVFEVGIHPEIVEKEINDFEPMELPPADTPRVLNGQVVAHDIDRFRFRARKGQRLVLATQARRLVPYMADAVPGWFQAALTISDAEGREVAYADDFRFDPDPVLRFDVPEDGEYQLEVGDAIHRGREDFVYRITIGEVPFVTSMFPLGGREGVETTAALAGWNLPVASLPLDTRPGAARSRLAGASGEGWRTNRLPYVVGDLPESGEMEPNDSRGDAQPVSTPLVVNGRIGAPGDVDTYRFRGHAGDEVVAEVTARRLRSPLDSVVRLLDADGRAIATNDDRALPDMGPFHQGTGLVTHHADSYLLARLPAGGVYFVEVTDSRRHGGDDHAYRLRIGPPRPDFRVMAVPSCINTTPGANAVLTVQAIRRDGFDGEIRLELAGAPEGFMLSGGRIPAGRDRVRVTLRSPPRLGSEPLRLAIDAVARVGGKDVRRRVVGAEDKMQAFLWRHLVPTEQILVYATTTRGRARPTKLVLDGPARIPLGGERKVRIEVPGLAPTVGLSLVPSNLPAGVSLAAVAIDRGAITVTLAAERGGVEPGFADNLILETWMEIPANPDSEKAWERKPRRWFAGYLPAIPIEVTK